MGTAMRFLLDTHALLWWWTNAPELSPRVRELIQDETNEVLVSAASAWEIATKHRLQKLDIGREAVARFNDLVNLDGFIHLPVSYLHALHAGSMDGEHRDPFDRMLAAQSLLERVPLVTKDRVFESMKVAMIW
jgi:PIN domain nuclease of toxin-antitoxin system